MDKPSWYTLITGLSNLSHSDLENGVHVQIAKAVEAKAAQLEAENERLKEALDNLVQVFHEHSMKWETIEADKNWCVLTYSQDMKKTMMVAISAAEEALGGE